MSRPFEAAGAASLEIGLRRAQMEVFRSRARFRVLVAGRRFGKTELALVEMLRAAAAGKNRKVWYVAPSARQAKRIAWRRLKELTRPFWWGEPSETDLSIRLRWGAELAVRGADRPDSLRGDGLDFAVLDEYASMRPECWTEVLRPALADRRGGALFIGTPQGCDHLFERFEAAGRDPEWAAFRFTTAEGGNVTRAELESAAREMDERAYRQEFEASFEGSSEARAYAAFSREGNVAGCEFRRGVPLVWSLDFNVNPMCAVLAQQADDVVTVLDEVVLENAGTAEACEAFLEKTEAWRRWGEIDVKVYGDASGFQRRTSGMDTDWGLIRGFFGAWRGTFRPEFWAGRSNPAVRDRVNVVNSRLCNRLGERRLVIDPRCRELIRDLEQVRWTVEKNGAVGRELDKGDRRRTHVSDALGYYVWQAFRVRGW